MFLGVRTTRVLGGVRLLCSYRVGDVTIINTWLRDTSSLVQVLTMLVGGFKLLAVCGIQITAHLLIICPWVGKVPAAMGLILMIVEMFLEKLTPSPYNTLEKCIALLPLHYYHSLANISGY